VESREELAGRFRRGGRGRAPRRVLRLHDRPCFDRAARCAGAPAPICRCAEVGSWEVREIRHQSAARSRSSLDGQGRAEVA
jgi:hypothetical protein